MVCFLFLKTQTINYIFRYNTLPDVINIMCNPLFIQQNILRQLHINYDPFIDVILRECELLARYSITMPDLGYKLLLDKNRIRLYYERTKVYISLNPWTTIVHCL